MSVALGRWFGETARFGATAKVWALRKGDADREPALGQGVGTDFGLMSGRNRSDDGEPEPVPLLVVRPALVQALKGLEETVDFVWRDAWSGIGHRQDRVSLLHLGHDLDTAVDDVVEDGVRQQVGDEPLDEERVSVEGRRSRHLVDMDPDPVDGGPEVAQACGDSGGEVDWLAPTQPAFAAGQGEEGFDQARLLITGGEHLFGGGTPSVDRRRRVVQRDLDPPAPCG